MKTPIQAISDVIERTGEAFDKNFTTKEEVLVQLATMQEHLISVKQSILLAEANGSKLQRNWRPILMIMFGALIVYDFVVSPLLNFFYQIPNTEISPELWELLKLSMGGYVIGRTSEKIIPGAMDFGKKMMQSRRERRQAQRNERKN